MTLKIRSRPLNSNQNLTLSQWYIYASLKTINPLIQKIFHLQNYDLENEDKVNKI